MQKSVYDKKTDLKTVIFTFRDLLIPMVFTYLSAGISLFERDIFMGTALSVSMIFYDRRYILCPFVMFVSCVRKGDIITSVMAGISTFLTVSSSALLRKKGSLFSACSSFVITFAGSLCAYRLFSLNDGFIINSLISSSAAFISSAVFSTALQSFSSFLASGKISAREELSCLICVSLMAISSGNISFRYADLSAVAIMTAISVFSVRDKKRCMQTGFIYSLLSALLSGKGAADVVMIATFSFCAALLSEYKLSVSYAGSLLGMLTASSLFGIPPGNYLPEWIISSAVSFGIVGYIKNKAVKEEAVLSENMISSSVSTILSDEISLSKAALRCISDGVVINDDESDLYKQISRVVVTKVCMKCENYPVCWLERGEQTFSEFKCSISSIDGKVDMADFGSLCDEEKRKSLSKAVREEYLSLRLQSDSKNKIVRFMRIYKNQITCLCDMLDCISDTINRNLGYYTSSSLGLMSLFRENGIFPHDVVLSTDLSGNMKAVLSIKEPLLEGAIKRDVINILSAFTGRMFTYSYSKEPSGEGEYIYVYEEDFGRCLKFAVSSRYKEGEELSGDSILIKNFSHRQLAVICDGMGSGEEAALRSRKVVKMLDGLLTAGYDHERAVELINSVLTFGEESEVFTTLDMLLYDRKTSEAVFLKAGAESCYIKRNDEIIKIKSETLPIGILESTHTNSLKMQLEKGDYVYLFSDGLVSAAGYDEEFIKTLILRNSYRYPQKVADGILSSALELSGGKAQDDISVIVGKLR
ncbi:MAG: SpoIIE family protein phosphatase [Eubacteriaceae bacterium]|nr:SpoIIE family protein phosphatase [Eubacteriaceae bacterium]